VPVVSRLAGLSRRMSTGTEWGGVRMALRGLPGPNTSLTPFDEGSNIVVGAVGFLILPCPHVLPVIESNYPKQQSARPAIGMARLLGCTGSRNGTAGRMKGRGCDPR